MSNHRRREKPDKLYRSFPLTAHNNGQWCKKIRAKVHFFGVWEDPQAALDKYLRTAADLHAGRHPREISLSSGAITIKDVCNHFLTYQRNKVVAGDISPRWLEDCRSTVESFAAFTGPHRLAGDLGPDDFQAYRTRVARYGLSRRRSGLGVHALNRTITVTRGMFKYAYEVNLLDKPLRFGVSFGKPSATLKHKRRTASELENGKRLFEPAEIRGMLATAGMPLRAMILLGINGGMGNTDCARLPIKAVNLGQALIEFERPKTGIERVVPLWPETVEAVREAIATRPKPTDEEGSRLVFLTKSGRLWVRENVHRSEENGITKVVPVDAIGEEFDKLIQSLGLKRKGIGFYALRHTFRTWADEVRDQHAIHRIMGHAIPGMSGIYVERIGLERLRAVTDHVRNKLFGGPEDPCAEAADQASTT